jgi:methionyl-tRNA synthetase
MTEKFWIVWNEAGHTPAVKHGIKSEAFEEAKRIAKLENRPIHVCECVATARTLEPEVVVEDCDRHHVCDMHRARNGECMVCGSMSEPIEEDAQ